MAKVLLHWFDGDDGYGGKLFVMPSELLEPYRDCKGYYINGKENNELKNQKVEHLAWMLGTEVHDGGDIPTLDEHLQANAHKLNDPPMSLEEKEEKIGGMGLGEEDWEERKKKLRQGPWSQYELDEPYLIQDVILEVFHVGWYC